MSGVLGEPWWADFSGLQHEDSAAQDLDNVSFSLICQLLRTTRDASKQ